MKGLLYKEFKMFECQVKTWAAVLVFLLACAVFAGETGPFIGGMCGFMVISSLSPFTEERRSGSDAYTAALPVSRREIVKARYGFLLLLDTAAAAVFGSCAMAAVMVSGKELGRDGDGSAGSAGHFPDPSAVSASGCVLAGRDEGQSRPSDFCNGRSVFDSGAVGRRSGGDGGGHKEGHFVCFASLGRSACPLLSFVCVSHGEKGVLTARQNEWQKRGKGCALRAEAGCGKRSSCVRLFCACRGKIIRKQLTNGKKENIINI